MVKLTKRKGFNFFRSYYDVYNELENDKDKISFIEALLDRQFLGLKPTDLKGMAKFAYISQTNSIDSQVKGFEDKTGIILHPSVGGCVGVITPPSLQVEVEGKVEVEEKEENNGVFEAEIIEYSFTDFWEVYPNKTNKKLAEVKFNKLTKEQKDLVEYHLPLFVANKPFKEYNYPHATTYLNQDRYKDEITTNFKTQENERLKQISTMLRSDGSAKYL
jgi:hypothetical protein